jgi:hypothetical protein
MTNVQSRDAMAELFGDRWAARRAGFTRLEILSVSDYCVEVVAGVPGRDAAGRAHGATERDISERMAKGVRELDVFETAAEEESILNHRLMLMIGTGIDSGNYLAMLPSDEWTKDARR